MGWSVYSFLLIWSIKMLFPVVGVANKRHRSGREIWRKVPCQVFFFTSFKKKKNFVLYMEGSWRFCRAWVEYLCIDIDQNGIYSIVYIVYSNCAKAKAKLSRLVDKRIVKNRAGHHSTLKERHCCFCSFPCLSLWPLQAEACQAADSYVSFSLTLSWIRFLRIMICDVWYINQSTSIHIELAGE